MWKHILTFLVIFALTNAEEERKIKKHYIKHHPIQSLLYGGGLLYYLAFIFIKIKVVTVLAIVFAVFLVGGKFVALLKYLEYLKPDKHHEVEKVYVPSHGHDFEHIPYSGGPSGYASNIVSSFGQSFDGPPGNVDVSAHELYSSPPTQWQGRSAPDYYQQFYKFINRVNMTDQIFSTLKIKSEDCRRKLICKIDQLAKISTLLGKSLHFLQDDNYNLYQTSSANSLNDCDQLYISCEERI